MTTNSSRLHRFFEITEFRQLVRSFGWDVCYTQLAPGRLELEAYETRIGDCLLFRERFGCPVVAHGASTPDAFDVMICAEGGGRMSGQEILPDRAVLFPPACAVDAVAFPGTETSHVHVPRDRLLAEAARWKVDLVRSRRAIVMEPGVDRMRRFRGVIRQAAEILDRGEATAWREVERELLVTLVALFDRSAHGGLDPERAIGFGARHALAVIRHVHDTDLDEIDISGVATALGIGRHHLNRCFKAYCGASIQEFVRIRRFHEARNLLRERAARLSVTEAAYSCGFSHLGRFSTEYRQLFGESPRQTLRRAAQPV